VLSIRDLCKSLPTGQVLFEDLDLNFFHGAKIGILGMNGAGKSSLMKILAGIDDDFDGEVDYERGIRVGYLAQEPYLDETKNVRENILDGVADKLVPYYKLLDLQKKVVDPEIPEEVREQIKEMIPVFEKIVKDEKLHDFQWQIERAISALKCPPAESSVQFLSGGERRRVALARLLIAKPDFLMLDEPTNHLDAASVAWLENYLTQYKGVVLAITHDRYFLDNVAGWILEIEGGKCHPFEGNYSRWLLAKQQRLELEKKKRTSTL